MTSETFTEFHNSPKKERSVLMMEMSIMEMSRRRLAFKWAAVLAICAAMMFSGMAGSALAAPTPGSYTVTLGSAHAQNAIDGDAIVDSSGNLTINFKSFTAYSGGFRIGYIYDVEVLDPYGNPVTEVSSSYTGVGTASYDGYVVLDVSEYDDTDFDGTFTVSFYIILYNTDYTYFGYHDPTPAITTMQF
jgi:hypothetical protein